MFGVGYIGNKLTESVAAKRPKIKANFLIVYKVQISQNTFIDVIVFV